MKPRLLILACSYPSRSDLLAGIFVKKQAEALSERYSVAVLAPEIYGIRGALHRLVSPQDPKWESDAIPIARPRVFTAAARHPQEANQAFVRAANLGLDMLYRQWGRPDLIAAHFAVHSGWLASILAQELRVPYVLHEHASPFSMYLQDSTSRQLAREAIGRAQTVVAVSPHLENEILQFEPTAKTIVIGNFVDTEHFSLSEICPTSDRTTFFAVGKASRQKGFSDLLKATAILSKRGEKDFRVIIGGGGPELPTLIQMAKQTDIAHVVDFLGAIPQGAVLYQMRACDCVVMPSLHESFCIVLAEAMACGKPVISTRCGGPEFFVDSENGCLVNIADPGDLADKMTEVIHKERAFDPRKIREKIHARFGKEAFLRNIGALYSSVLQ